MRLTCVEWIVVIGMAAALWVMLICGVDEAALFVLHHLRR